MSRRRRGLTLDAEGARRFGGRFNSKGRAVVYASDSLALAALEVLVHADASNLAGSYVAVALDLPERMARTVKRPSDLPSNWRDTPAPAALRRLGDAWLDAGRTAMLVVPSAGIPEQQNVVLSPAHADFKRLVSGPSQPFVFDPRLKR